MEQHQCKQEAALKHVWASIGEIKECLKEIKGDMVEIKVSLASPRGPSWAVASILTILTSVCVSFIVFYITVYQR